MNQELYRYRIKAVKMQDTQQICYEIWDLEQDECIFDTFAAEQAQTMLLILNGEPSPSINQQGRWTEGASL